MIATQRVIGAPTPQAIATRAIGTRMVSRAIKDRRIAGRRGRPQEIAIGKTNGAIRKEIVATIAGGRNRLAMRKMITGRRYRGAMRKMIARRRGRPQMVLNLLNVGAIATTRQGFRMIAGRRKMKVTRSSTKLLRGSLGRG